MLSPKNIIFQKENVSLQDIEKERIILHRNPSTTRDLLTKWMLAHNITFQSEIELDSLETMKQILKYGNGVAFISKLAIEQEVQRNELCYIPIPEFEFQRNIYTIHHEDRWNSKIISFYYITSLLMQQKLKTVVLRQPFNYNSIYFSSLQFLLAPLQPYLMLLKLFSFSFTSSILSTALMSLSIPSSTFLRFATLSFTFFSTSFAF